MVKILFLAVIAAAFALQHCEAALKCHYCVEACEVSKATPQTCGKTIGDSQEAVCTTEIPKDSKTPNIAVRKCQIVTKGKDFDCPPNTECKTCRSELCNASPSVSSNVAMMGVVVACLVAKFTY